MKHKEITKIILLLLVMALTLSIFTACKKNTEDSPSSDSSDNVATDSGDTVAIPNDVLEIPEDLDFGGQDVTFLAWSDPECTEFEVDKIGANTIANSIYTRNKTIEHELGIEMKFSYTPGNVANTENFVATALNASQSGTPYDIISAHTFSIANCAINGLSLDLGSIDESENYMKVEKNWWNQEIVDACSLRGSYYFVTGDISTSFAQRIYCLYFNADKIEQLHMESPYDMVANNTWTLENMISMCKNVFSEANGNTSPDM